jgi:hypothetical protein
LVPLEKFVEQRGNQGAMALSGIIRVNLTLTLVLAIRMSDWPDKLAEISRRNLNPARNPAFFPVSN